MKMPKRGEKGFTLIELLIVVAILGVLAAVVIPNVGRFIGRGESEASDTEFSNVQAAVQAMMVDNGLATLPNPVGVATSDMSAFPDSTSACTVDKLYDPSGTAYIGGLDVRRCDPPGTATAVQVAAFANRKSVARSIGYLLEGHVATTE